MENKKFFIIKVLGLIIVSLLVSTFLIKNIFLANSPRINPEFIVRLKNSPSFIAGLPSRLINSISKNLSTNKMASNIQKKMTTEEANQVISSLNSVTPPPNAIFKAISTGVSAAEQDNGQVILKIEKGTQYKVRRFTLSDGRTIDIVDLTGN